jgi:ATP-binding cassette, subfamily D (ALD), peroxisomal long-chain fatty acid import protein
LFKAIDIKDDHCL